MAQRAAALNAVMATSPRLKSTGKSRVTDRIVPSPSRTGFAPFTAKRALSVFDRLDVMHPGATTELHYRTPFELLVATILSAQCTDARVNEVTPGLFKRYPDARALAMPEPEVLEPIVQPTGFFRMKSRSLSGMARALVEKHDGKVPASMDALVGLPGVGRKTANVVLGHALGIPGLPVDRHVLRVAGRIGLVQSADPEIVETELCALLPPERWTRASDTLILHGRRICKPKPLCDQCSLRPDCAYFLSLGQPDEAKPRKRAR